MYRSGEGFWTGREASLASEWLETNGLGGYASSTLPGLNTRRYHGLLVAATKPPVGRSVLLSKLEETLVVAGERFELSMNAYPGVISPEGDRFLRAFRPDPFPTWTYEAAGVTLTRTLFLAHGENTAVIRWSLEGAEGRDVRLEVRPLLAFRDYHALGHENGDWDTRLGLEPGRVTVRPYAAMPALGLAHDAAELDTSGFWYRHFEYERERERGFDFTEDLFGPFRLVYALGTMKHAVLVASTRERTASDADELQAREEARRARIAGRPEDAAALRAFRRAADQFLVARGDDPEPSTVIAGYPWFTDWGRDTMIALPGLALVTGRPDVAKRILATFAKHVDAGIIPNRFPDAGEEPEYNTVDATLWFVEAVRAYRAATGDEEFVRELLPVLLAIVDAHERGTRYGIRADVDGLLSSGADGVQLTWMDARVGDRVVTPRRGKPVEIQALWFNALSFLASLTAESGDAARAAHLATMAERARASFDALFWNEEAGCLYDVVDGETKDASIRPNQVLALSLAHPLVTGERAACVLATVERELLTPYGLRTLSHSDPRYVGRYEGGPEERDGAYHQGTVWPWLLGPFVLALVKSNGGASLKAAELLRPLIAWALGPGLGQLPEIFDGDAPQRAGGCFAQAWSVAQVIEAVTAIGNSGAAAVI